MPAALDMHVVTTKRKVYIVSLTYLWGAAFKYRSFLLPFKNRHSKAQDKAKDEKLYALFYGHISALTLPNSSKTDALYFPTFFSSPENS